MEHDSIATWSSELYLTCAEKIIDQLARRYGNNKHVWGWQLDNELSHYGKQYDYSEASQQRFRQWLQRKYSTIENLNRDLGYGLLVTALPGFCPD